MVSYADTKEKFAECLRCHDKVEQQFYQHHFRVRHEVPNFENFDARMLNFRPKPSFKVNFRQISF